MNIKTKLKTWFYSDSTGVKLCVFLHNALAGNSIKLFSNSSFSASFLQRVRLHEKGTHNQIRLGKHASLKDCQFIIHGTHNKIMIGDNCRLNHLTLWLEDNDNTIEIGAGTFVAGYTKLSCIEGTSITVGQDCMFSSDIEIRTGDSHSITDLAGARINPSQSVSLADHVWIGHGAFVGKGVLLPAHSIVGAKAVVTKGFSQPNIAVAGNPAKVVKENIDWEKERL